MSGFIGSLGDRMLGVLVPKVEARALCARARYKNRKCVNDGCALWTDRWIYYYKCPNGKIESVAQACGSCAA